MLHKTKGIVLHQIKYSESSIIAHIYTEEFGRQSYIVKGARSKKSSARATLFQPLFLLEMEVYYNPKRELQNIKEVRNYLPLRQIPCDVRKSSIALFLAEILYRTLREETPNGKLFDFLLNAIQLLDRETAGISHFHIVFLVKLTKFLGFFPNGSFSSKTPYFDLLEGCFCRSIPEHIHYVAPPLSKMLSLLTTTSFEESARICFETTVRSGLLGKLLEYFRLHMDGLKEIRSYEVLKSVFI